MEENENQERTHFFNITEPELDYNMDKIVENGIPVDPKDLLAKASTL